MENPWKCTRPLTRGLPADSANPGPYEFWSVHNFGISAAGGRQTGRPQYEETLDQAGVIEQGAALRRDDWILRHSRREASLIQRQHFVRQQSIGFKFVAAPDVWRSAGRRLPCP